MLPKEIAGHRVVGGEGPRRPKLILVGESLGEQEEAQNRPFCGTDGKILDGILGSSRIRREDCYITNVVKIRPPNNKVERLKEIDLSINDFVPLLQEELQGIDCKVCVPLGDVALNVLCSKDGITKHRGSIYLSDFRKDLWCVPTYNPGYIREFWQARGTLVTDLLKAQRVAKEGYTPITFNTQTYPTVDDVETFINSLLTLPAFSFDIETVGSGQIACVGIGGNFDGERKSLCVPFKHGYKNFWDRFDEVFIWQLLEGLFHSNLLKIGQFISYDLTFLAPFIGEPTPPWYDTSVAHHTIDPELPHDLAYLTSIYTDVPYYKNDLKEEGESWKYVGSSEMLWEYNGKDVEIPLMLEPVLTKEMSELDMLNFYRGYQMPLVRVMWRLQRRGMCVDEVKKQELLEVRAKKLMELQVQLDAKVGYVLNVGSAKQIMKFLYQDLKLPIQYHRKTRKPTANKEALERLASRYPNETFQLAMEIRDIVKDIGTYLNALPSPDGRYRGRYNPCGTETGRSSCSQYYGKIGLDKQNVPEELRVMFVPTPGKVFLIYDLWQAEAYVVAVLAKCRAFLEKLRRGEKIHTMVAGWIYGKKEEEITAGEYHIGKRTVHASNYGLGPVLFSVLIKRSVKDAKEILATYHRHAPEVEAWHREVQEELGRTRRLLTPFGRLRFFRNRFGEEMFREAYSHLPQSTIADYCHQAMIRLEYCLPKGARIVQEGFDSLIIEGEASQAREIDRIVREAFNKELFWQGEMFKIPVESKITERWTK